MKVVLPDATELELPDGATGLDAARAIGPKLAEQAVLVRSNGAVQDLRLPLADGAADPDPDHARQGRPGRARRPAPLGRAPARRGRAAALPGREDRDRPADRERLLLRLRVPRADPRGRDLERIEEEIRRELAEGRDVDARGGLGRRGAARFEDEGEPYKVELVDTADGADLALHAGRLHRPLPRARTCRTRRRSRPSSSPASPARTGAATSRTSSSRASTAPPSTTRPTSTRTSSGSSRRARATTAASAPSSTSSTSTSTRRARRSGTRRGW